MITNKQFRLSMCLVAILSIVGCDPNTDMPISSESTHANGSAVNKSTTIRDASENELLQRSTRESLLTDEIGKRVDVELKREKSIYSIDRIVLIMVDDKTYTGYIAFKTSAGEVTQSALDVKYQDGYTYTYTYDKP